jgi:DNA repair protein RecN (Recombination protein N)
VLAELAGHLVAVHGQSDQVRLARPAEQRAALDRFAGVDLSAFNTAHERWLRAQQSLRSRLEDAAALRRESDVLSFGLGEIEAAAPLPGEDVEVAALVTRLGQADALRVAARTAHDLLLGDAEGARPDAIDVTGLLGTALRSVAATADPELGALGERLSELSALVVDLGRDFADYADALDADPARLDQLEARRAVLAGLVRKYADGPAADIDGVLSWAAAARARLAEIDVSDEAITALRAELDQAARSLRTVAEDVSQRRHEAADRLSAAVSQEIAGLAMPDASVRIAVNRRPPTPGGPVLEAGGAPVGVAADGVDEVEILLRPHRGAPELPLGRGASGGELSRVMLAIEVCLADTTPVPMMVFDEVDAGVGGRAAVEIGRRLARLARQRQILVVTHLAQVAAYADRHIVVDKPRDPQGSVTASDVRVVDGDARLGELARMLSGSDTATAREHAAELLAAAEQNRTARPARGRTSRRKTAAR